MRRGLNHKRGFTITELIVAIAILGLFATIALPNIIRWVPAFRVNAAARNLASEMQLARLKAVAKKTDCVIAFNSANNEYTVAWKSPITLPKGIRFGRALDGIKRTSCGGTIKADGIHLPGGGSTLSFQSDGTPKGFGGSIYIIPISDDEDNAQWTQRWKAVSVNTTGRVKVWRYDASAQDCGDSQGPWR
ncbi:MAG: prepilin-type N-terminal cleavage/methylation domain-containing protein [Thermodesulfobacteriota bacterium]|nr:prepilin-type N-terminal cleavage/methylation domain-containing protein [Thermodesulfobacteriota bacterium]